ncbi:outer membrane beta-barrel protein [Campylobacter hepaticus]|uniref:Outer membrane beta-barrel protein n=1 Tax=Campylobacter hepaticus TaxID=1813019 RepID=A0A6A7JSJ1_9BACT|nr:outer membrane beta-barrel protein [Campylobacter hepaticus]AXP09229.1 porin family protein [Campylobacter hepaticus]MCZ0771739.1 outer membrane beta-barrel protein [Campylobacter hepaticus]MCZ0773208.1 outer membrane beta-barrel protein [Campylobacter hepaticus]MCZ0775887.1 outer membrane beta-barrel protein [Campylobacter hepaticus]MDX2331486.1 outer membrane beta-barrel protein [Campylobacter hepaticus]
MNKKLLSAFSSLFLFTNLALADENSGFFIGADAAWMHAQVKSNLDHKGGLAKAAIFNGDVSGNIPVFGLRIGYRLNQTHRIYSAYNYSDEFSDLIKVPSFEIQGNFTTHKFLLGYDFTPKLFESTRAVLGGYLGYAKTNIDLKTSFSSLGRNFDGFVYGLKAGAMYELNQNNEVELGFKAEQISYNSKNFYQKEVGSNFYNPTQRNYGVYLAYNYKF